jgi:ankyrin repeat protein
VPRDYIAENNHKGENGLTIAADRSELEIVRYLVSLEADVTYGEVEEGKDKWAKMQPVTMEQVETIGKLLSNNKALWKNSSKDCAEVLYWAARNGYNELAEELLQSADTKSLLQLDDTKTEVPGAVLHWAAVGGHEQILKLLLGVEEGEKDWGKTKAIIDDKMGPRAVQAAAYNGHAQVVQQLLEAMVKFMDERIPNREKCSIPVIRWMPLHWAVNYMAVEAEFVVRQLLMYGADPEAIKEIEGETSELDWGAVDLARKYCHENPKKTDPSKTVPEETDLNKTLETIINLLQTPYRPPRNPSPAVKPQMKEDEKFDVYQTFHANIIDFYPSDGHFNTLERKCPVVEIIYQNGPDNIMKSARKVWEIDDQLRHRFRWIHLPVNNVGWKKARSA